MKRKRWVSLLVLVGILVMMMGFAVGAAEVAKEEILTMEDVWAEIEAAEKEDRTADFAFKTLESLKLSNVEIKVSLNFTGATILWGVELKDVKIKEGYGSYINFYQANIEAGVWLERAEIAILNLMETTIKYGVWLRETSIRDLNLRGSVIGGWINIDDESRVQLVDFYETQVEQGISVDDGALALAIHLSRQSDISVPVLELEKLFLPKSEDSKS